MNTPKTAPVAYLMAEKNFSENPFNGRFLQIIDLLTEENPALNDQKLAKSIGMSATGIGDVRGGRQSVRTRHLANLFEIYGINPMFIFAGQLPKRLKRTAITPSHYETIEAQTAGLELDTPSATGDFVPEFVPPTVPPTGKKGNNSANSAQQKSDPNLVAEPQVSYEKSGRKKVSGFDDLFNQLLDANARLERRLDEMERRLNTPGTPSRKRIDPDLI